MSTKKIFMVLVMSVFVLVSAQAAMAGYTISTGDLGPYRGGTGGEFTVTPGGGLEGLLGYYVAATSGFPNGIAGNKTFQTFCVETGETLAAGETYDAFLNTGAVLGGVGGFDALSNGTAYLYSQFAAGTLKDDLGNSYQYNPPGDVAARKADAGILQQAIWFLEGEASTATWANNKFLKVLLLATGGNYTQATAVDDAVGAGLFEVRVLNLTQGGVNKQDVLTVVPIPGAVWLLGSGLLGLLGFRRKFVG